MTTLVLCSGGLKSALLLAVAAKETEDIIALFIDYGQADLLQDRKAFFSLCKHYAAIPRIAHLPVPSAGPWQPFQLSYFIFYASMEACKEKAVVLYYGTSCDDISLEAAEQYLVTFRHLALIGQPTYGADDLLTEKIEIEAPLTFFDMKRVIHYGSDPALRVPWGLTYSCERGGRHHCGKCMHCLRRIEGFQGAKKDDPAHYQRVQLVQEEDNDTCD